MQIRPPGSDLSIVLSGEAGQGIQTVEAVLMRSFKSSGLHCFSTSEFMSRIRGGNNSTEIRLSPLPVNSFIDRIDLFMPLGPGAMERFRDRITENTLIIGEEKHMDPLCTGKGCRVIGIPLERAALEAGDGRYTNTVLTGVLLELFRCEEEAALRYYESRYRDNAGIVEGNALALAAGRSLGRELMERERFTLSRERDFSTENLLVMTGSEAVGAGALAAGCNFIASYPMSPSTGVLVFMAQNAGRFSIVAEQAEDEIAAINMALGAWYAGARAMVTTSGGGFALMTEGLSLAGAMELPVVINLAQRPGPATGLPTRTEQGDLDLALYAGHGTFPRIILAPADAQQAFDLSARAFDLADEFQVPVILLTDQYLLDSTWTLPGPDLSDMTYSPRIVQADAGYIRYRMTENGITPRAIPGYGEGTVCCDSDEHTEDGRITEDRETRINMVQRRTGRMKLLEQAAIPPVVHNPDGGIVVLCWGSTYHAVMESLPRISGGDIRVVHCPQLFPLPLSLKNCLQGAKKIIAVENNVTGQFATLVSAATGYGITDRILKFDGHPFSVEGLASSLERITRGG